MEKLPKFFKKGVEKGESQDKLLIQKTDRSNIIDNYKELLTVKMKEKEENKVTALQGIKGNRKNLKKKLDFKKNLVDVISTISDSMKPNFGVGITGKNLKITPLNETTGKGKGEESKEEVNRGITTMRDENTGYVKVKALPYSHNPKIELAITRKEYFENGVREMASKAMAKLLNQKKANFSKSNMGKKIGMRNLSEAHSSKNK